MLPVQGLVEVKADKQRAEQLAEQAAEKWSAQPPSPEPVPRTPKQVRQWQSLSAVMAITVLFLQDLLEGCSTICSYVQDAFFLSSSSAGAACRKLPL